MDNQTAALCDRFQAAVAACFDEARQIKLKTIEYLLFDPLGQDVAKASELLSEMGF